MTREIYFAGGCFWGTQHFFKQVRGVKSTRTGYANGNGDNPTYEQVYTDLTGFAETVRVEYDARVVSLERLIELYFLTIDPTSLNRQGEDSGTRYRTGIYFTSQDDLPTIKAVCDRVAATLDGAMVVEIEPLRNFFSAEEYHQDYLTKNPTGYCHIPLELMRVAREANAEPQNE